MTASGTAMVDEAKPSAQDLGPRSSARAPVADAKARAFLRKADPVLARLIDARPDFRPRAWIDELPPLDAFGTLIFQVAGQQLSVRATRTIVSRIEQRFGGHLPSPAELLAADPQVLRDAGMSGRRGRRCERSPSGSSTAG
jgi:DNA-3-methyladenine glycosylase II